MKVLPSLVAVALASATQVATGDLASGASPAAVSTLARASSSRAARSRAPSSRRAPREPASRTAAYGERSSPAAASGRAAPALTLPDFAGLAERVVPAVAKIETEQKTASTAEGDGASPFDLFHFGRPKREREARGLGSGFFIDASGVLLTNAHVVESADHIRVTFPGSDGVERTLEASVVGIASEFDVALLRTAEPADAAVVTLGDSDTIRIGDWVMAVGNPFGLDHSVSVGIISAKERRDIAPSGRQGLYNFLQTDASINPGNSGGPLLNTRGEVIGINSAVNSAGQGIGFAIPINMVKRMLPALETGRRYVRSWVGVRIQPVTAELAHVYGLDQARGVLVAEVVAHGPAARAGVREGDVILDFDGQRLARATDLPLYASMAGVGRTVPITVWRDKKPRRINVRLEAYPAQEDAAAESVDTVIRGLGLKLGDVTEAVREKLGTKAEDGALVESVQPASAAARAGIQAGDVILAVDGRRVSSAAECSRLLGEHDSGQVARLHVERRGTRLYVTVARP